MKGVFMTKHINLVKLCVGAEKVEDLLAWQAQRAAQTGMGQPRHVTRMWPKRRDELLAGGSLYWVFKGVILARQRIVRLDEVMGGDGILRCGIVLDPDAVRTAPSPRKPFQGWRYLRPEDAPPDLRAGRESDDVLPQDMQNALADLGIL
jgi:hypothetical protein